MFCYVNVSCIQLVHVLLSFVCVIFLFYEKVEPFLVMLMFPHIQFVLLGCACNFSFYEKVQPFPKDNDAQYGWANGYIVVFQSDIMLQMEGYFRY